MSTVRSDAQVEAMCADARQRVDDASPADFLLAVSRAHCRVDHEQQFACERACQQSASCDPGTVETRCPDLAVSGLCSAACPATCEGSPAMPTNCEGKCFGACLGSCVGPRRGDICEGSCLGLCGGDCTLPESTTAPCSDGVRCLSRCAGAWSELACESPLLGSPCGASGYCFAACGVVGAFGATCEPASIASEGLPAALDDAIALSYPRLLSLPSYELLYVDPALLLVAAYDVLRADHPDADHCPATPRATLKDEREQLAAAAASLLCLTSELRAAPCF
jgi:hypothetical protein